MWKADLQRSKRIGHIKQILAFAPKACVLRGFVYWARSLVHWGVRVEWWRKQMKHEQTFSNISLKVTTTSSAASEVFIIVNACVLLKRALSLAFILNLVWFYLSAFRCLLNRGIDILASIKLNSCLKIIALYFSFLCLQWVFGYGWGFFEGCYGYCLCATQEGGSQKQRWELAKLVF